MFNADKRAERHEARVQRIEATAEDGVDKALRNLRARRAWVVQKLALPTGKPAAFNDDLEHAAKQLVYLDDAIAALSTDR